MDVIELTFRLITIPSPTGREGEAADYAAEWLRNEGFSVVRQEIEPGRTNVFASAGGPVDIVLCSHLDTVPTPAELGEDEDYLRGRGACDAKGSLAAMMVAARTLRREGFRSFGLLLVCGEETDSRGAKAAVSLKVGSRFIIVGEPTGNKLALGHKGILSLRLKTTGRAAHSAFPHRGESAIDRLLDALMKLRGLDLGEDPVLGKSTLNIGRIEGGIADNILAPEACASIMIRCAIPSRIILDGVFSALGQTAECEVISATDPIKLGRRSGYETTILPFGSDAPYLGAFGERFMLGPGDPEDAHTEREKVGKHDLEDAVVLYNRLVRELSGESAGKAAER